MKMNKLNQLWWKYIQKKNKNKKTYQKLIKRHKN